MSILIENLSKQFNQKKVLNHINLEIQTGFLVALLGPSGSGKSTLLRIIAGFEKPNEGCIWLSGKKATNIKIQDRQLGFVFQDYALFPHLTVFENIAFGMNIRKMAYQTIKERVQELLQLIQLENEYNKYPFQLSGGQKQRVALARALAIEPTVLLLDEPFGALDVRVRKDLRFWLRQFHQEIPVTTLFVTHDQQEAMEIANEIVIFEDGHIIQTGFAKELIEHPSTTFVKNFLDL
uniref:Putative sulfate/thiosulfate import ATP-binding protein CysA n=1 Tax=Lambia antarctica TaxID=101717 RepID=A0A1L2EDZ9_9CHLO|nr:putative sulfate/thiosulfate import ATP-binding protein CysA [Lambia antarctica]ANN39007.1 putative sulfate/thiosulfate import ATP-binding protein CysA [Lambia antarctica]